MEDSPKIHQALLNWAKTEYKDILNNSEQAMYLYVCDKHRMANENFVYMLGYDSLKEWEMKDEMMSDVIRDDQDVIINAYQNAMEKNIGSTVPITWINKKDGTHINTKVILVPLSYKGTQFALHFITKI
jgi:hypothetical protein